MMLLTRRACHSNGNDRLDKVQVEIPEFYPAFTIAEFFISFGETKDKIWRLGCISCMNFSSSCIFSAFYSINAIIVMRYQNE